MKRVGPSFHLATPLIGKVFLVCLCLPFLACEKVITPVLSETREAMGTVVSITLLDRDAARGAEAIESAYRAIESVERSMSTYDPESEISHLNREGSIEASDDFLIVLQEALAIHRRSGGAFDVTMKPLLELLSESFAKGGAPPSAAEVQALLGRVDAGAIEIEDSRVTLPPGVRITLDGIAKGHAIDRAIEALRAEGVEHALVDAGGDMRALGDRDGEPWRVAMQDPRDPSEYLTVIFLTDRAVATSGDYRRYFDPEMTSHHILDPRTGRSAESLISVSVQAETAMVADALATAIFVLGPEEGRKLAEDQEGVEAFLVTDDRRVLTTSGW
jgi:FAD:protein FMN transferase